jgi:hypothetical protein
MGSNSEFFVAVSEAITPSDTVKIPNPGRGFLVSVAGVVKVGYADGSTDSPYLLAGVWHPMEVNQVFSTGTDAAVLAGTIHTAR